MKPLDLVVLDAPGTHDATVLWLHGLGADGNDFVPAIPHLRLPDGHGVRFVFPTAEAIPITVNGGFVMPAWYDIRSMELEARDRNDAEGLARSVERVRALLVAEVAAGIDPRRIVVAGFSQGGAVALELALTHPEPLAALVLLSTYVVDPDRVRAQRQEANATIPILQCHGTHDSMVPLKRGEAAREFLVEHDYVLGWKAFPMDHEVCAEELDLIGRFLTDALDL
ncbi:MAG: alpha/beta fold hydrolase [Planctomycetota bacterium]|nr:alpha/beta fold hydrolase [Planctomycetota bacterium]